MREQHIEDYFEDQARKGDGAFAIALALMKLAREQAATAYALQRLGNADASTPFGAIEALGMQVEKAGQLIADAMLPIAETLAEGSADAERPA